jgi:hypothetical protein
MKPIINTFWFCSFRAGCVIVFSPKSAETESSLAARIAYATFLKEHPVFLPTLEKPESFSQSGALSANNKLESLTAHFLMHGATMPLKNMAKLVQNFAADTVITTDGGMMAKLDEAGKPGYFAHDDGITMLAPYKYNKKDMAQMLPGGDSALCGKRELIVDKFDALLNKLGGMEVSMKIESGQATHMSKAAMEAWLSAESQYRLREEQANEAKKSAKFAEQEFQKWRTGEANLIDFQ